uniref:Uncharacterized protein n=1 Tax=Arundo donax TaxID=35708 RepID=A0A0A9BKS1_ARUDO
MIKHNQTTTAIIKNEFDTAPVEMP